MIPQVEATVEELVRSPLLPFIERRIHAFVEEEQKRRAEFHRAIDALDPRYYGKKIEFINGEVMEVMPAKMRHWEIGQYLLRLIQTFVDLWRLGKVGYEKAMISLSRNDYEPDICFWNVSKSSTFDSNQARFPVPDFIVEILSPSTEKVDRVIKFKDYAAHGVAEYWIVDPEREMVEQYFLRNEEYVLNATLSDGVITSRVIDGFQIPARAIFDTDANLAALQEIMTRAQK
jgi:Uma2 family endonuclease